MCNVHYTHMRTRVGQVYTIFTDEMASVSRELASRATVMQPALCYHPKYGGQAHYFRLLKRRIELSMMTLDRCAFFLPECETAHEARTQYQGLAGALDEYVKKCFYDWQQPLDREPLKLLDVPLMRRSPENPGTPTGHLHWSQLLSLSRRVAVALGD